MSTRSLAHLISRRLVGGMVTIAVFATSAGVGVSLDQRQSASAATTTPRVAWSRIAVGQGSTAVVDPGSHDVDVVTTRNGNSGPSEMTIDSFSPSGRKLWTKRYGVSQGYSPGMIAIDPVNHVLYMVTGRGTRHDQQEIALVATSRHGHHLWTRDLGLTESSQDPYPDQPAGITLDPKRGLVYVAADVNERIFTVALSVDGHQRWRRVYGASEYSKKGSLFCDATAVALDPAHHSVDIAGSCNATRPAEFTVIQYSAAGHRRWVRSINPRDGSLDQVTAMAVDPTTGGIALTGVLVTTDAGTTDRRWQTAALTHSGRLRWVIRTGRVGPSAPYPNQIPEGLSIDWRNHAVSEVGLVMSRSNRGFIVVKSISAAGHRRWIRRSGYPCGGECQDGVFAIAVATDSTTHRTYVSAAQIDRSVDPVVAYSASGKRVWHHNFPDSDQPTSFVVDDADGRLVATLSTEDPHRFAVQELRL